MREQIILTRRPLPERQPIIKDGGVTFEASYELVSKTRGFWPFRVYAYRMRLGAFIDNTVDTDSYVSTVLEDSAALPSGLSYLRYRNALHSMK